MLERTLEDMDKIIRELLIVNPDNLVFNIQDVQARESFDAPSGQSTRGGGDSLAGQLATAAAGPAGLRFLHECNIPLLDDHA